MKNNNNEFLLSTLHSKGKDACPCRNTTQFFASKTDCTTTSGLPGLKSTDGTDICFPLNYGSSFCEKHDMLWFPGCTVNPPIPQFCYESFCYVDYDKCKLSTELFFRSDNFGGELFYSYSTCNASAASWTEHVTTEALLDRNLKVVIPVIQYPFHYKLKEDNTVADLSGPEYYNNSIPFRGALIDYLQSIAEYSPNIAGIDFEFRSRGSDLDFPTSKYTASVRDVQVGLSDMAAGPFWVTAERMRMASFTTPIIIDKTHLIIPRPKIDNSTKFQIKKLIMPFSYSLWLLIIGTVVAVGLLSIWFSSPKATNKRPWLAFRNDEWREASWLKRGLICYRQLLETTLEKGMEFFGIAVDYDFRASLPHKYLMFGFSFLTLIAASAYVATLAAHLTMSGVSDYIESMEEAIKNNIRICVHPELEGSIDIVWPDADFYFSRNTGFRGILQDWDDGRCDILAFGWIDTRYNKGLMHELCKRDLVFTKALVIDIPIAFPINSDLAAGISHYLLDAETKNEILFEKMINHYTPQLGKCEVDIGMDISSEKGKYPSLTIHDLTFPFVILAIFAVMAIITKICDRRNTLIAAQWLADSAKLDETSARRIVDMVKFAHLEIDHITKYDVYQNKPARDLDEEVLTAHQEQLPGCQSSACLSRRFNSSKESIQHGCDEVDNVQQFRGKLTSAVSQRLKHNDKLTSSDDSIDVDTLFGRSMKRLEDNYAPKMEPDARRVSHHRSRITPIAISQPLVVDRNLTSLIENAVERSVEHMVEKSVENAVEQSAMKALEKAHNKKSFF